MIDDLKIVGTMLVSRNHELLDITIPNLMKYCDWALIVMDNETMAVESKVYEFQKKYVRRIFVRRSSIPHKLFTARGRERTYRERSKSTKGIFRDDVFVNLNRILDWKKNDRDRIDILLWPDSDEIWTDYLPELLDKFWKSGKLAVMTKPIDVVNNMKTIKRDSMGCHVHILRYSRDFSAYPWRQFAMYKPLTGKTIMRARYYSVHLAYLTKKIRDFRRKNWKADNSTECELIKLDKSVEHMSPQEIYEKISN